MERSDITDNTLTFNHDLPFVVIEQLMMMPDILRHRMLANMAVLQTNTRTIIDMSRYDGYTAGIMPWRVRASSLLGSDQNVRLYHRMVNHFQD